MIELSDQAKSVIQGTYVLRLAVESWLGGQLLADEIPVANASEEVDRSLKVPERVTLTVPRIDPATGINWSPTTADHPLAANGQRLRVQLGIDIGNGQTEWITRGWYLISDSEVDGDQVNVTGVGLLALIDEARLVTPYQPTGTLVDTLRGLLEPALTVVVDDALTDRSVPSGINYDEDRLQPALDLLDAWPATAYVAPDGYLHVIPATVDPTPVLTLTDRAGGTVVTATGASSRDGAYSVVVAQGTASDGGTVQGVAQVTSGPHAIDGPFNPLPVPYFYSSPLLTTNDECTAAAQTIRDRLQRDNAVSFQVTMVPNPALQVGDVVAVNTADFSATCTVERLTLPWVAGGGRQEITVRSLT